MSSKSLNNELGRCLLVVCKSEAARIVVVKRYLGLLLLTELRLAKAKSNDGFEKSIFIVATDP